MWGNRGRPNPENEVTSTRAKARCSHSVAVRDRKTRGYLAAAWRPELTMWRGRQPDRSFRRKAAIDNQGMVPLRSNGKRRSFSRDQEAGPSGGLHRRPPEQPGHQLPRGGGDAPRAALPMALQDLNRKESASAPTDACGVKTPWQHPRRRPAPQPPPR